MVFPWETGVTLWFKPDLGPKIAIFGGLCIRISCNFWTSGPRFSHSKLFFGSSVFWPAGCYGASNFHYVSLKIAFLRSMRGVLDNCFFYSGTLIFSAPWGRRLKFLRSRRISHAFSKPHTELKNALLNFGVAWLHHIPLWFQAYHLRVFQKIECSAWW